MKEHCFLLVLVLSVTGEGAYDRPTHEFNFERESCNIFSFSKVCLKFHQSRRSGKQDFVQGVRIFLDLKVQELD